MRCPWNGHERLDFREPVLVEEEEGRAGLCGEDAQKHKGQQ